MWKLREVDEGLPTASTEYEEVLSKVKNELKHTAHSSYRCEYHVVFAPKYRRKVIYNVIYVDERVSVGGIDELHCLSSS